MGKCVGTTKSGIKCRRETEPGSLYCWQHGENSEAAEGSIEDLLQWTANNVGVEDADRLESYFKAFHPEKTERFVLKTLAMPDKQRFSYLKNFIVKNIDDDIEGRFDILLPDIEFQDAIKILNNDDPTVFLMIYKAFLLHFNNASSEDKIDFYQNRLTLNLDDLRLLSYEERENIIYQSFKNWLRSLSLFQIQLFIRNLFDENEKLITIPTEDFQNILP